MKLTKDYYLYCYVDGDVYLTKATDVDIQLSGKQFSKVKATGYIESLDLPVNYESYIEAKEDGDNLWLHFTYMGIEGGYEDYERGMFVWLYDEPDQMLKFVLMLKSRLVANIKHMQERIDQLEQNSKLLEKFDAEKKK